jgi:periplasmic divalent cation tolerance protein
MHEHVLVLITCGDRDEAVGIARRLVAERYAAGAQVIPIASVYRWQGDVIEDDEQLVLVKTRRERFDQIESLVAEMHSYEVPPVLMLAIDDASAPYLAWIDENV